MSWIKSIGKLFSGDLLTSATKLIDECFTSDEEKQAAVIELEKLKLSGRVIDLDNIKTLLNDIKDARNMNVRIQESDKASWLAKNTPYLLSIFVTLAFFGLLFYMMKYDIPESSIQIINIMIGVLGTVFTNIVGFYFGSSTKRKDK